MNALTRFAALSLLSTLVLTGCKQDDAKLTSAVQARLSADSALTAEPIRASVQNAVVTLDGAVSSDAARSLAASDASQVSGVRTVVNNLVVSTSAAAAPQPPTPEAPAAPPAPASKPIAPRVAIKPIPQTPQMAAMQSAPPPPPPPQAPEPPPQPAPIEVHTPAPPPPPPPPAFKNVTLPAGTGISIRITQTLDSASTRTGDAFSGSVASDVMVDGLVAIPHGAGVSGRVDDAKDAAHYTGSSHLAISLVSIDRRGERISVTTDSYEKTGAARGKNTAEKVGGGAAVGAILGGILGGGKGAAIGAAAGGGAGAGANTVTRGQQVQIPSESVVRFQLASPVTVRVSTENTDSQNPDGLQRR